MTRRPRDPGDELMPCPRGCGTDVQLKNAGKPHTATKLVNGELVYYTCKD